MFPLDVSASWARSPSNPLEMSILKLPIFATQLRCVSTLCLALISCAVAAEPLASAGKLLALSYVERKVLAPLDLARVQAEDTAEEGLDLPQRFAMPIPVSVRIGAQIGTPLRRNCRIFRQVP